MLVRCLLLQTLKVTHLLFGIDRETDKFHGIDRLESLCFQIHDERRELVDLGHRGENGPNASEELAATPTASGLHLSLVRRREREREREGPPSDNLFLVLATQLAFLGKNTFPLPVRLRVDLVRRRSKKIGNSLSKPLHCWNLPSRRRR